MGGNSIMPTAKLVHLGCASGCCDCDCDRIVTPSPPYIVCGCKYKVSFTGSYTLNYTDPDFREDGCGVAYYNQFGSIGKGADLIFYGGPNGLEGSAGVSQECRAGYNARFEACDGDGDEECCNIEDNPELCLINVTISSGCKTTPSCTSSSGVQTTTVPLSGTYATIEATLKPGNQIEVNNLSIMGFNGPAGSGRRFPVNVSFPGGSQQVLVAPSNIGPYYDSPATIITFSGSVKII
jgi:hypothetical protein